MSKVIIGIHGLANKSRRHVLKTWWRDSIAEGLRHNQGIAQPHFRFEMVYWADLLYKHPLHDDAAFSFDKLYNKEPYYPAKKKDLERYDDRWIDRVRAEGTEIVGRGLEAVKDTLGVGRIADALLARVLRDLAFYWDSARKIKGRNGVLRPAEDVLNAECRDALVRQKQHEICLIAHSMGSIIAYNVLRDLGRTDLGIQVPYYVTIGSPLGLAHVKSKTRATRWDNKVRTPSIVTERWVNLADRRDPVAFDTHLADDYGPNALGVRAVDDLVLNDYAMDDPNPHKSYGYLRTPEMSALIASFLQ